MSSHPGQHLELGKHLESSVTSVDRLSFLVIPQDEGGGVQWRNGEYKDGPEVKHICYTHRDTGIQVWELGAKY